MKPKLLQPGTLVRMKPSNPWGWGGYLGLVVSSEYGARYGVVLFIPVWAATPLAYPPRCCFEVISEVQ